jgi:hypothetical protein
MARIILERHTDYPIFGIKMGKFTYFITVTPLLLEPASQIICCGRQDFVLSAVGAERQAFGAATSIILDERMS